jgi:adenosine kinase
MSSASASTQANESALFGAIVGMCNPLLDISIDAPEELLTKYGLKLNNAILAGEEHLPLYKEIVKDYPHQFIAGGATQNSIRVAQWMLQTPGSTAYFGAVGEDEFGSELEKCAREDGVLVSYQKSKELPTGTCAVLINKRERSLCANLGAANSFSLSHLETKEAADIINRGKIFYISGFFLTVSIESILHIARHAVQNNKLFTMNLSAPFIIEFFGDQLAAAMPFTDFVFANESEAEKYGEVKGYGSDLSEIALKIAAQPKASGTRPRVVVFTQGSKETIVAYEGVVTHFPVDQLDSSLLVDTNGAGDAFVGEIYIIAMSFYLLLLLLLFSYYRKLITNNYSTLITYL